MTQKLKNIYIEISGCCNGKCKYCCTGQGKHITATKFMTAEKFEEIILKLKELEFLQDINTINLYNWGEPFLNPKINEILCVLGKHNLKAGISSNFIKKPDNIHPNNFQFIHYIVFSLCSLKPERYKRIYGANLEKTLSNFDFFVMQKSKYNKSIDILVAFHKYRFNKNEFDKARKYFKKKEAIFKENYYATINDGHSLIEYLKTGKLDGYESARKDLYLKRFHRMLSKCEEELCLRKREELVINESGNLALCCGVTSQDTEYNLGNILELGKRDIFALKEAPLCSICEQLKLPALAALNDRMTLPNYPFYYKFLTRRMIERLKKYKFLIAIKKFIYDCIDRVRITVLRAIYED